MEELQTENLRALLRGEKLNDYQKALANSEYKKLIMFAYEMEKQVKKLTIPVVVGQSEQLVCPHCKNPHLYLKADDQRIKHCPSCCRTWAS